jgi:hypothetical protein
MASAGTRPNKKDDFIARLKLGRARVVGYPTAYLSSRLADDHTPTEIAFVVFLHFKNVVGHHPELAGIQLAFHGHTAAQEHRGGPFSHFLDGQVDQYGSRSPPRGKKQQTHKEQPQLSAHDCTSSHLLTGPAGATAPAGVRSPFFQLL